MTKWVPPYRVIFMFIKHGQQRKYQPVNMMYSYEEEYHNEEVYMNQDEGFMNEEECSDSDLSSLIGSDVVVGDDEDVWEHVHDQSNVGGEQSNVNPKNVHEMSSVGAEQSNVGGESGVGSSVASEEMWFNMGEYDKLLSLAYFDEENGGNKPRYP